MENFKLSIGYGNFSYRVNGLYVLYIPGRGYNATGTTLAASFFERSAQTVRSACAQAGTGTDIEIQDPRRLRCTKSIASCFRQEFTSSMTKVAFGRDSFWLGTLVNKRCDEGGDVLLTSKGRQDEDFYNFLMKRYKLRLKEEWTPVLREALIEEGYVDNPVLGFFWEPSDVPEGFEPRVQIGELDIRPKDVVIYDASGLSEESLDTVVSGLLQSKAIRIAEEDSKPLGVETVDPYIERYGRSIVENLENQIETLAPLSGTLEGFAAKTKRLFPQQAACINGVEALMQSGSRYGMLVEGMGCGKTIQSAAAVDSHYNRKWLKAHPGKTLRDMYNSPASEQPKYRAFLMAPSHLVSKWKSEIESEIPGSRATIVSDLKGLAAIKAAGRKRTGREWFLFSKDFAKLGAQKAPTPQDVRQAVPKAPVCIDCLDNEGEYVFAKITGGKKRCPKCGGTHFRLEELPNFTATMPPIKVEGMVCPKCGNPLIRYEQSYDELDGGQGEKLVLSPADFASHKDDNDRCFCCGELLWGVDAKNIGVRYTTDKETGLPVEKKSARRWYKVSHYKNHQRKGTKTAWVLKGHEKAYEATQQTTEGWQESKQQVGPRKWAPSLYIKKHLKGYVDVAVLDECHKYEGGGTAQSLAAHAMMKAAKFTLCLTGTITNGKADSMFYLLYMLDPARMRKMGYRYGGVMDFARKYGSIITRYETQGLRHGSYNSNSRGKMLGRPKIGPGISPLLYTDFLLDKAIMLDLSDLSKYLPALKEKVEVVPTPEEVIMPYNYVIGNLKAASKSKDGGGMAMLSTMLQFGLSYPDKPYGRSPVMHPYIQGSIVTAVPPVEEYRDGATLLPKEERLVEIINGEIAEGRNCFVYCAYTGSEELNIMPRLQNLVETRCNLKGAVCCMKSASPEATKREAFIQKKASEGIRVFICNMKLVETGLDFCFKYEGVGYNYPTIIFYQLTYELSVMWQASRRHYRLNQTEECRTYYLVAENTLQTEAVRIMAEKQVAASAIQGKFSAEGLASMATGVDPRLKLAQALAETDNGASRESLENMFDVMNAANNSDDERYGAYTPPMTYYELMGEGEEEAKAVKTVVTKPAPKPVVVVEPVEVVEQFDIFDMFNNIAPVVTNSALLEEEQAIQAASKPKKKAKKDNEGQITLFSFLDVA